MDHRYYHYSLESLEQDHYAVIGVPPSASSEDIRAAYRSLARQMHPDKNGNSEESKVTFQKLQEASEVLLDAKKRSKYDRRYPVVVQAQWDHYHNNAEKMRHKTTGPQGYQREPELTTPFGPEGKGKGKGKGHEASTGDYRHHASPSYAFFDMDDTLSSFEAEDRRQDKARESRGASGPQRQRRPPKPPHGRRRYHGFKRGNPRRNRPEVRQIGHFLGAASKHARFAGDMAAASLSSLASRIRTGAGMLGNPGADVFRLDDAIAETGSVMADLQQAMDLVVEEMRGGGMGREGFAGGILHGDPRFMEGDLGYMGDDSRLFMGDHGRRDDFGDGYGDPRFMEAFDAPQSMGMGQHYRYGSPAFSGGGFY